MAALGLGSYGSDASSDEEDESEPYPLTQPLALEEAEESDEDSEEEEEEAAGAVAEEEEMIGPVVPLALSGAVEESDEEEAQAPWEEDDDEEQTPSLLPPPDFGNWDPEVRRAEANLTCWVGSGGAPPGQNNHLGNSRKIMHNCVSHEQKG